jgi:hypothetical protein
MHLSGALGAVLSRFTHAPYHDGGPSVVLDHHDHAQACEDLWFLDFCGLEAMARISRKATGLEEIGHDFK